MNETLLWLLGVLVLVGVVGALVVRARRKDRGNLIRRKRPRKSGRGYRGASGSGYSGTSGVDYGIAYGGDSGGGHSGGGGDSGGGGGGD